MKLSRSLFQRGSRTPLPERRNTRAVLIVLVVVLVCLIPALAGVMVFDDLHSIISNPAIRTLDNIPGFFVDPGHFSSTGSRMYRPIVLTSLAIDCWIGHVTGAFGAVPSATTTWPFKLGNVLEHLVICWLLFEVLLLLARRVGLTTRGARQAAVSGTLLFGLHPLHTETICLVSSRSEILAAIGLLIALRGWLRGSERGRPIAQCVWLSVGTAFACLSKEIGVLVPAAVLLVEVLVPPRSAAKPTVTIARIASAAPVAIAYLILRRSLFGVATVTMRAMQGGSDPMSGGTRDMGTQLTSMALFLPKAVYLWLVPGPLNLDHQRFYELGPTSLPVVCGGLFVIGIIVYACAVFRRRPLVTLGILGAFLFAGPWIVIPLNQPFAEHRLYSPLVFMTMPVAIWCGRRRVWDLARSSLRALVLALGRRPVPAMRPRAALAGAVVMVVTGGLFARTVARELDWVGNTRIWIAALRLNPQSFRACCGISYHEFNAENYEIASRYLERAYAIYPGYKVALVNLLETNAKLMTDRSDREFHDRCVSLAENATERFWKDPFLRLLSSRIRYARFRQFDDEVDLRAGLAWALSCLAMVEPKMLVYRTAAIGLTDAGLLTEALSLFDACERRGLENPEFLLHKCELLLAAGLLDELRQQLAEMSNDPSAAFDAGLLQMWAKYHAARNDWDAWRRTKRKLEFLGYDTSELPEPAR